MTDHGLPEVAPAIRFPVDLPEGRVIFEKNEYGLWIRQGAGAYRQGCRILRYVHTLQHSNFPPTGKELEIYIGLEHDIELMGNDFCEVLRKYPALLTDSMKSGKNCFWGSVQKDAVPYLEWQVTNLQGVEGTVCKGLLPLDQIFGPQIGSICLTFP